MDVTEMEELRVRYRDERPSYETLAKTVETQLREETRRRRLICDVEGRAKEIDSFLKKALRKGYESPWDSIRDKAGVRVVTIYESQVGDVGGIVEDLFQVHSRQDKRQDLRPETLAYLGVHYEVSLPAADDPDGRVCEVQIHTRAQHLWATVSHELLYKPAQAPPDSVTRAIYRLMALIELFDGEVDRGREEIFNLPGYEEARVLATLERHFYSMAARPTDPVLSRQILEVLRPLFNEESLASFDSTIEVFVESNREKLEAIYSDYEEDTRNPLLSQPESLLVFELLSVDPFRLTEVWAAQLPPGLLSSLGAIWGTPVEV